VVQPAAPRAGEPVSLVVIHSPSGVTDYQWDLSGTGAYAVDTGAQPRASTRFAAAGVHRVAVRIHRGSTVLHGMLQIGIRPPRAEAGHSTTPGRVRPAHRRLRARAARDPAVTIADFSFSPATTTVHVGDTVSWSNDGPSSHTATAQDGSFNTGVLQKGAGASHTFGRPGTFSYFCQIHPFMHGTIVVVAAATNRPPPAVPSKGPVSSASTGTSNQPSAQAPPPAPSAAGATLPVTGADLVSELLAGLGILGGGAVLRRVVRHRG
jgi:plastocyanin